MKIYRMMITAIFFLMGTAFTGCASTPTSVPSETGNKGEPGQEIEPVIITEKEASFEITPQEKSKFVSLVKGYNVGLPFPNRNSFIDIQLFKYANNKVNPDVYVVVYMAEKGWEIIEWNEAQGKLEPFWSSDYIKRVLKKILGYPVDSIVEINIIDNNDAAWKIAVWKYTDRSLGFVAFKKV
ncbi:hypothetical protein FACS189491_12350 [Spirochaetia bacterium]|nr:hypothetical protein FACS189491_12350 [Spirochaetia bacterium]